ncbi:Protein kinase c eta type [Schistosoma japonicum]|nr:Protein kinase c eta type [Schistosoma japonicum]
MSDQNVELTNSNKRQFYNDNEIMQTNENKVDSISPCKDNHIINNHNDDDDDESSTSRYSTADSSPCEDLESNVKQTHKKKDYNTNNQQSQITDNTDKSPQNKNLKEKSTNSTMNHQSVALEFRTVVQRDEYGYGFRVCGNKPVSVHNVRKDSNAEKAGLKAGDQIVEVNGIMAVDLNHEDVVEQIRSRNQVSLRLRRLRYQVVDALTGYRVGSMRNLTCNEAPILRSQQRHYYQKRRSVRESAISGNTASAVVRRRPRLGTQTFKIARSCSPPPSMSMESVNESLGPHTDEDIDWSKEEETNLEPNPSTSPQLSFPNAASLPPTSRMVRPRSSVGPSERTSKERPVSSGPDMFALFKRSSVKDINYPERVKEEESPIDESPHGLTTTNASSSSCSRSLHRMSLSGHSNSNGASINKGTGNLKDQSTFSSSVLPPGRVMGRNFDDEGDSDLSNANDLAQISCEFNNATSVLNSPAKCGMFIDYLFSHKRDPTWTFFYIINQYFQRSMLSSKELYKDEKRVCVEIFTTFLHEKSPLRLDVQGPVLLKSFDFIECTKLFNSISQQCLNHIQTQLSKLSEAINLGMDTWCLSEPIDFVLFRNKDEELASFESRLSNYLEVLHQFATGSCTDNPIALSVCRLPNTSATVTSEQIAQAITACLVTAHRYYSMSHLSSVDYPETRDAGHSIRQSLFARSFENLTSSALGNAVGLGSVSGSIGSGLSSTGSHLWTKLTSYCAKSKQKSHSLLNRRTKWSHKGHSFYEFSYERIADCGICGFLLWGPNSQGFNCNNCDLFIHLKCKNGIRDHCSREGRKTGSVSTNVLNGILGSIPNLTVDTHVSSSTPTQINESCNKLPLNSGQVGSNDLIYHTTGFTAHRRCGSDTRHKKKKTNTLRDFHLLPSFLHRHNASGVDNPLEAVSVLDETINSSYQNYTSNSGLNETSSISANSGGGNTTTSFSSPGLSQRDSLSSASGASTCQYLTDSYLPTGSGQIDRMKSCGEEFGITSNNDLRYVKQMKSLYDGSESVIQEKMPTSRSDSVITNVCSSNISTPNCVTPCDRPSETPPLSSSLFNSPGSNINETVRELVTTDWSDDPEMIAGASFEAAVELRAHFPNFQMPSKGQKSDEYIRTLVLLEFHQKTQYMVRYLKQYEYLLLRRWPMEHAKLSKILCLDQIPILINLFRSLVTCIDQTKTEQGYRGMAEAVLAWLTDNSSANLKTWARHCQALSCSNMLECVRHVVRDYVRRHPDIVPLLQTRHNKFVLIEGLKQMRILYFNLPLIANNIAKDLEKKTKMYKAEANIWQQIQSKLASLPQTIDNVCMPLVKRINLGQLNTSLDKKDILSKPLPDLLLPFQNLLLNFPRVLFHHWVVAHAEVTVDKLTANRSNKVNHDYICERTDMLAILLHDALILMVKDSDRYTLRSFKAVREQGGGGSGSGNSGGGSSGSSGIERLSSFGSPGTSCEKDRLNLGNISGHSSISSSSSLNSPPPNLNIQSHSSIVSAAANAAVTSMTDRSSTSGSSKLVPIFPLIDVFTSCGEKFGGDHLLNIVFMKQTVLIRLLFSKEEERQNWSAYIQENGLTTQSLDRQRVPKPTLYANVSSSSPQSLTSKNSDITPTSSDASVITPQPSTQDLKTSFGGVLPITASAITNNDKAICSSDINTSGIICSGEGSAAFIDKLQTSMNELLEQTQQIICEKYNISKEELANAISESSDAEDILNPGKMLLFQIKYFAKCFSLITRTLAPQSPSSILNQIQSHLESLNDEDQQQLDVVMRQKKRQSSLSWTEGYLESLSRNPILNVGNNETVSSVTPERCQSNTTDLQPDNDFVSKVTHSSPNLFGSDSERSRIDVQDRRKSKRRSRRSEAGPLSGSDFNFFNNLLNKELITMAPVFAKSVMCLCKLAHQDVSRNNLLKEPFTCTQKSLSRSSNQIDSQVHWTKPGDTDYPVCRGSTEEFEEEEVKTLANSIIDLSCSQTADVLNLPTETIEQSNAVYNEYDLSTNNSSQDLNTVAAQLVSDVLENAKMYFSSHIIKPVSGVDEEHKTVNVIRDSGCAPSATDDDDDSEEADVDDNNNNNNDHRNNNETIKEILENLNGIIPLSGTISAPDISTPKSLGGDCSFDNTLLHQNNPPLNDDLLSGDIISDESSSFTVFESGTATKPITAIVTTTSTTAATDIITTNIGRNDSQKSTTSSGYVDSSDD